MGAAALLPPKGGLGYQPGDQGGRAIRHDLPQGQRRHQCGRDGAQPDGVTDHPQVQIGQGPDLVDRKPRPADNEAVRLLNGPGGNAASIRNGVTHQLKPGDVVVIPAGTGHWFTKIDDHITYLMVRLDPDKIVPLKDEAASKADLASPPRPRGRAGL